MVVWWRMRWVWRVKENNSNAFVHKKAKGDRGKEMISPAIKPQSVRVTLLALWTRARWGVKLELKDDM